MTSQTEIFIYSIICGIILGVIYDIFRITRIALKLNAVIIAIEDILYLFICAVMTFFYMLASNDGQIRFFIIVGEILGWVVYYFTVGEIVMGLSTAIIKFIKGVFRVLYRLFIAPVIALIGYLWKITCIPVQKSKKTLKKLRKNTKFRLKSYYILLYNVIRSKCLKERNLIKSNARKDTYEQETQI